MVQLVSVRQLDNTFRSLELFDVSILAGLPSMIVTKLFF